MSTATDTKKLNSLPFDPLWEKARRMAGADGPVGPTFTSLDFAQMVGHNVKAVTRWQAKGQVPWTSADRAAVEMGVHPMAVWGFDWLEVQPDYEKIETGALDTVLDKAINRAEAKGEVVKDGKILGRGWTELARQRTEALEAELLEKIVLEALYPVDPLDEAEDDQGPVNSAFINSDGNLDFDPEIEMSMSDVYALEGLLVEKGLLEG